MLQNININSSNIRGFTTEEMVTNKLKLFASSDIPIEPTQSEELSNESRITNHDVPNNSGLFHISPNTTSTANLHNSQQISDTQDPSNKTTITNSPFQKKEIMIMTRRKSPLSEMLTSSTIPNITNNQIFTDRKTSQ